MFIIHVYDYILIYAETNKFIILVYGIPQCLVKGENLYTNSPDKNMKEREKVALKWCRLCRINFDDINFILITSCSFENL